MKKKYYELLIKDLMLTKLLRYDDTKLMKDNLRILRASSISNTNWLLACEQFLTTKPMRKYFVADPSIFSKIISII